MEWIHNPTTDVEVFINEFVKHAGCENDVLMGKFSQHFRSGYCWHFAHTLKTVFQRGEVCWAAPFGHMVWRDTDGTPYDIEGRYEGEAMYLIPEHYSNGFLYEFMHIKGMDTAVDAPSTKKDLIEIVKKYCKEQNEHYLSEIEKYFIDKQPQQALLL